MKNSMAIAMAVIFGLFLMPLMIYAQSGQAEATPPPVAPTLVREGDFATELVTELNLGTAQNEAEAESMLTAAGIAPRNGWISDYPVTPDIVAELQQAIGEAAEANRLPLAKDAALNALQKVETSFDMAVVPDTSGQYAESPPPTDNTYADSSVVDNYYSEEGPPVLTYYPPPPDYGYLYAWVPSPFWCGGFFFPGFFVLNDFNVFVTGDHHGHGHHDYGHHYYHGGGVISNHVRDPHTGAIARIDPVARTGRTFHAGNGPSRGFTTPEARRGASAISGRSIERAPMHNAGSPPMSGRTGGGTPGRNWISPGNERLYQSPPTARPAHPGNFSGREFSQPRMSGRSFSSPPPIRGFNSDGFHGFAHGGSLGGFHGGGPIRGCHGGPSFGGFHGGGGMRR